MDAEEKNEMFIQLMNRKRKLIDLREEILIKSKSFRNQNNEGIDEGSEQSPTTREKTLITLPPAPKPHVASENDFQNLLQSEYNPHTPFSIEVPSISPPPFSPLTPLAVQTKFKLQNTYNFELLRTISPPLGSPSLLNNNDPASSPVQPMSPETQKLYNELTGEELKRRNSTDIIENSDNVSEISDDSLYDPDFVINKPKQRIVFESEPESDSTCDDIEYSNLERTIETEKANPKPAANKTDTGLKSPQQNTASKNNTNPGLHENVASLVYENAQDTERQSVTFEMAEAVDQIQDMSMSISLSTVIRNAIEEQNTSSLNSTTDNNNEGSTRTEETQNLAVEVNTTNTEIENTEIENQNVSGINTETDRTKKRVTAKRSRKERTESKILRNTGKRYVSATGSVVPERKTKNLKSSCRLKCAERFSVDEQKECFQNYWNLGDRERRAAFVSKSITILPKKTQKTAGHSKNRDCYCVYNLQVCGEERLICKECFCRLLDETIGFVNVVIQKKKESTTGIIDIDQRGKNPPKTKKTIEDMSFVKNHILSFPSYESHYCRKCTGKKYLSPDLSIAKMYREYKLTTSNPVSLKLYAQCFHELKLSFKQPSKDTCNTCDVFQAKIKVADENNKVKLIAELSEHQAQAEKAYSEKRIDKDTVKRDSSVRAFAFDLQQCLPTPYLKTSVSFYKRQLWSFNLTIHDLSNNEATCYMWDETIGARGANQIASCLWHFCKRLPSDVKEIIFYSDTCGGQNKNNTVAMMFMYLLKKHPTLQTIHHKFLLSGHTHMECDSDHAVIEKVKKRTQMKINHLNDWIQLVRTCKVQKHFKVVAMTLKDFYDFTELKTKKGPFSLKKQNEQGEAFLWQPIKWLYYSKEHIGKIQFKDNLDRETPFKSVNIKKRGKITVDSFKLTQISSQPLPIRAEKKKDLMDLMQLIDEPFREFYLNIKTTNCAPTDPDLDVDNPDIEET